MLTSFLSLMPFESYKRKISNPSKSNFLIFSRYDIQEDGTGITIKISGAADWKKSINFMIKPFISASVKTNLALGAKIVFEKLGGKICYT